MIGFIVPGNRKYTPYIENYINVFKANHVPFRILSWNRNGISEADVDFSYPYPADDFDRKRMLLGYLRFTRACKGYIRKNGIDRLVILTAAPAFFLTSGYLKKFRNRFILDIRDDSPFIRRFPETFRRICHMAQTVVVSSEHYSEWTGRETVLCHNADLGLLKKHKDDAVLPREENDPVRITYAGIMIEGDCNIRMLETLKNDPRFLFTYIGKDSPDKQKIAEYTKNHSISNACFEGIYEKTRIVNIYQNKADLINILRNDTRVNRDAVPNKMYEAVLAGRPLLVYHHNQAIVRYVNQYHLGIVIPESIETNLGDYLYSAYRQFDLDEYAKGRSEFLNRVCEDMDRFAGKVKQFSN